MRHLIVAAAMLFVALGVTFGTASVLQVMAVAHSRPADTVVVEAAKPTPKAPVGKLALLRLDGDMYESTYVSLTSLYDRLSPGGYVLIDDYNCYPSCKQAVADFAAERRLSFKIEEVDWTGAFWRKD